MTEVELSERHQEWARHCEAYLKISQFPGLRLPIIAGGCSIMDLYDGDRRFVFAVNTSDSFWLMQGWWAKRPLRRKEDMVFYTKDSRAPAEAMMHVIAKLDEVAKEMKIS